jgi:two-component system, OmpR family, phosphate regulon response regulator PhoB
MKGQVMETNETVLVAARDPSILSQLNARIPGLQLAGYDMELPPLAEGPQYWCFVDWLLPDISGIELCRQLRELPATRNAHITMVVDDDGETKKRAMRCGADDYLVGPIDVDRLVERLGRYRKTGATAPSSSHVAKDELQVDMTAMLVRYKGQRIALAPNEFRLLAHFVEHPDRVFTRAALIETLGKDDSGIDERTVDVWIGRIRRTLKAQGVPDRLRTVRSMGYVFDGVEA